MSKKQKNCIKNIFVDILNVTDKEHPDPEP